MSVESYDYGSDYNKVPFEDNNGNYGQYPGSYGSGYGADKEVYGNW